MSNNDNVFFKTCIESDKLKALNYIIENKNEILAKPINASETVYKIFPTLLKKDILVCDFAVELNVKNLDLIILKFNTHKEQFVAQCRCELIDKRIHIDVKSDFFKLMRRDDFRIKLPSSYRSFLNILDRNKEKINLKFPILDLSAGGCRIEIIKGKHDFSRDDEITAELLIEKRTPIFVEAIIKHTIPFSDNSERLIGGIQFLQFTDASKDKMVSLMLDIYRILFAGRD